ncbi:vWA domain-containing protein [Anaeromyxobacter oryzae]|uniref:VWA domain-containing protein n=1 Tax=Anaeromyxobacter oryzae TaxID=2918170 RepID=A0ABM7X300_9BACT|nr:VWA domain-containing protein [Anaeromyxobacter oryzae]BDG06160.1 VWA domain-containing protein [Anaeromyxobacter oryzae]
MSARSPAVPAGGGHLPSHVVRFARVLRRAGLAVGTDRVAVAMAAAAEVGLSREEDLYWALHAVLVSRAEHRPIFDEAFRRCFRGVLAGPGGPDGAGARAPPPAAHRRVADALAAEGGGARALPAAPGGEETAALAWSDREVLRTKDFEQMSAAELREAEEAIARMHLAIRDLPVRRLRPDPRGDRVDPRATLRAALRAGGGGIPLRWRSAATRPPAIVALCDVSGSMARYARIFLRFLHALARDRRSVHVFTFGTRLTPVTRLLRHRDPDEALAAVGRAVKDWDGGTRIGAALRELNLRWARRLLAQGGVVLLLTDGLDRDDARGLAAEAERLRRAARRVIWLNPLLRWAGFEPRAAGIRALLPHVDELRPVHDLESLSQLAAALSGPARPAPGARAGAGAGSAARARRAR